MGHDVFPDISERKVKEKFRKKLFPQDTLSCSRVLLKCWTQQYSSVDEVAVDLEAIEVALKVNVVDKEPMAVQGRGRFN